MPKSILDHAAVCAPATARGTDKDLGTLPGWNLDDLYPGRDSAEFKADLAAARAGAQEFETRWKGRLAEAAKSSDDDGLGAAVEAYEKLEDLLGAPKGGVNNEIKMRALPGGGMQFEGLVEEVLEMDQDEHVESKLAAAEGRVVAAKKLLKKQRDIGGRPKSELQELENAVRSAEYRMRVRSEDLRVCYHTMWRPGPGTSG